MLNIFYRGQPRPIQVVGTCNTCDTRDCPCSPSNSKFGRRSVKDTEAVAVIHGQSTAMELIFRDYIQENSTRLSEFLAMIKLIIAT